jgi:uncharacterized protein
MRRDRLLWILVASAVMALLLTGCGSSRPAKFYTLNAVQPGSVTAGQTSQSTGRLTVGLGPVEIPDYIDRPQIVTRTLQNELTVAEYSRWGGSLRPDVVRVVLENLSRLMAPKQVSVVPWTRGGPLQYRVALDVARFDATPGREVWLNAQWTIFSQDGKVAMASESNIREPLNGSDIGGIVTAMSQALGGLTKDMADGLTAVISAKPEGESR